jgi:hypothetical protein
MTLLEGYYGLFYRCNKFPSCDTTHRAHPNGTPTGTPANKDTRELRKYAHQLADYVFNCKTKKGKSAFYSWFGRTMCLSKRQAHIGLLGKGQLQRLIYFLEVRAKPEKKKKKKKKRSTQVGKNRNDSLGEFLRHLREDKCLEDESGNEEKEES